MIVRVGFIPILGLFELLDHAIQPPGNIEGIDLSAGPSLKCEVARVFHRASANIERPPRNTHSTSGVDMDQMTACCGRGAALNAIVRDWLIVIATITIWT